MIHPYIRYMTYMTLSALTLYNLNMSGLNLLIMTLVLGVMFSVIDYMTIKYLSSNVNEQSLIESEVMITEENNGDNGESIYINEHDIMHKFYMNIEPTMPMIENINDVHPYNS
jgi:hypothetical protein